MTYTATFDGVKRDELFAGPEIDVSVWNVKVGSDATITRGMILAGDDLNGTFAQANSSDTGKVLCIAADNFDEFRTVYHSAFNLFNNRKIVVFTNLNKLVKRRRAYGIAAEENLRSILGNNVVVLRAAEFNSRPRAEIAAADTDDYKHLGIGLDFLSCLLDSGKFLFIVVDRQVNPS